MGSAFESWIGSPVVVQLDFGQTKVAVHGMLLEEKRDTLMMRTREGCEFEIYKTMVLAIEQERGSVAIIYS
jgi:RNase P/RNase MRP subunit p29